MIITPVNETGHPEGVKPACRRATEGTRELNNNPG